MVQVIAFVCAIVLVYAVKAFAITRSHEELAENDAAFSWMHARSEDLALAQTLAVEEQPEAAHGVAVGTLRHAGGFSA